VKLSSWLEQSKSNLSGETETDRWFHVVPKRQVEKKAVTSHRTPNFTLATARWWNAAAGPTAGIHLRLILKRHTEKSEQTPRIARHLKQIAASTSIACGSVIYLFKSGLPRDAI